MKKVIAAVVVLVLAVFATAIVAQAQDAAAAAQTTIEGKVNVIKGDDGAVQAVIIYPAEGHGYKVDLSNDAGKSLEDKGGQTVKATGVDNVDTKVFTVSSVEVVAEAAAPAAQ